MPLRKNKKIYLNVIACWFAGGVLLTGCGTGSDAKSQPRDAGAQGVTPVDVAIAQSDKLGTAIEYSGTTEPVRSVLLRSQIEGQLLALNVDVGDPVKRGQTIAQIDDALLRTQLNQAEAELAALNSEVARANTQVSNARVQVEQTRIQLLQAQADAARLQKLLQAGAIAAQQAEQARTAAQTAAQVLRAATEQVRIEQQAVTAAQGRAIAQQAVVAQVLERRSYSRVTSPITGLVMQRFREPGDLIQPGNEVLQLGDFSRIQVRVEVSDKQLATIQVGQTVSVRIDAFANQTFNGQVQRISPAADATARLVPIDIIMPNSNGKIGSGLLARVTFESRNSNIVVPESAVRAVENQQNQGTIFVVAKQEGSQATVATRSVTLGNRADGKVEVLSGLQVGDRFVANSGKPLKAGEVVRVSIISETPAPEGQR